MLEGPRMKRRTKIIVAAVIIVAIIAGTAGTYYLTVEPAPAESISTVPCNQVNDDNPWGVVTTIIRENTTDPGVGTLGAFYTHEIGNPERVRMSWDSDRPITVMLVWRGGEYSPHPVWLRTATSVQEVLETNLTADGKLFVPAGVPVGMPGDAGVGREDTYMTGFLDLLVEHINMTSEGVTYELTVEIPKVWATIVSCTALEIRAGVIEMENSTFTAEERIRVTFSAVEAMIVELRRSNDSSVIWTTGPGQQSAWQWFHVQAEDIGQSIYLYAHADVDIPAHQPSAFAVMIEVPYEHSARPPKDPWTTVFSIDEPILANGTWNIIYKDTSFRIPNDVRIVWRLVNITPGQPSNDVTIYLRWLEDDGWLFHDQWFEPEEPQLGDEAETIIAPVQRPGDEVYVMVGLPSVSDQEVYSFSLIIQVR